MFYQYVAETQTSVLFCLFTQDECFAQMHYHSFEQEEGKEWRNLYTNLSLFDESRRVEFFRALWEHLEQHGVPEYMRARLNSWFQAAYLIPIGIDDRTL